jgi:hypothetical protein
MYVHPSGTLPCRSPEIRRRFCSAAFSTVVLLLPVSAFAQTSSAIRGRTLDQAQAVAVGNAQVQLLDARGQTVATVFADSAGAFHFNRVRPGPYRLRAQSLGYPQVTTPELQVPLGEVVEVVVWLAMGVLALAPLEVVSRPAPLYHRNVELNSFYERAQRKLGGKFMVEEEIDARGAALVTDMLRIMGVWVIGDRLFTKRLECAPVVYLDGTLITEPAESSVNEDGEIVRQNDAAREAFRAVNILPPQAIAGIEVYAGAATVPGQFSGHRAACGVVAIWSKR